MGYIIFKDFIMRVSIWPYPLILYDPIRYTNDLCQGIAFASFVGKWTFCFASSDKSFKH